VTTRVSLLIIWLKPIEAKNSKSQSHFTPQFRMPNTFRL